MGMSPSRRGVRGRLSRSGGLNWLRGRWGLCLRATCVGGVGGIIFDSLEVSGVGAKWS